MAPFQLPKYTEIIAFMGDIAPTPFGTEYVVLAKSTRELILCEVVSRAADGTVQHAKALPFN